jgi:hypothetical protein
MKKLSPLSSPWLTGIFVILVVAGCDSGSDEMSTKDKLLGTWTVSTVSIDATVGAQSVVDYLINVVGLSPTDAAVQYGVYETFLKSEITGSITFKSDMTYESNFGSSGPEDGTWSLSPDEKTLTLDEGTADETELTLNSITGSTLAVTFTQNLMEDLDDEPTTPDVTIKAEAEVTLTK